MMQDGTLCGPCCQLIRLEHIIHVNPTVKHPCSQGMTVVIQVNLQVYKNLRYTLQPKTYKAPYSVVLVELLGVKTY